MSGDHGEHQPAIVADISTGVEGIEQMRHHAVPAQIINGHRTSSSDECDISCMVQDVDNASGRKGQRALSMLRDLC
jgi:hypothetical protein